ncbi:hypothetical protein GJAV_G00132230 [Gymnothorax javanicus]|nr:hypothetical protein GJAV_G00132230 [Gymnothorax javanicus]
MPSSREDRLRVAAVVSALKAAGVRVKNWKNFLNEETNGDGPKQESRRSFAFGRDLTLLPQCHMSEVEGTVPRFMVEACEFLSQHLHTEGLFRKTGSLSRIRALRAGLEQAQPVFSPPLSCSLQPCDVASLLKQFLRELPSPLVPLELQGALCRAQGLGPEGAQTDGARDRVTLLVTALFPSSHVRALRYLCTFLRSAARRCSENRMDISSLALVMAPNLLQGQVAGSKLTVGTERLLERQAAVIMALISHAERIGVIPSFIMEMLSGATLPQREGAASQERAELRVYRSLRRQRRRSVGEMFVDAFSKFKTARTPNGPSQPVDCAQAQMVAPVIAPQSPSSTKRKASEDALPEVEGSAKKRRSIHDLRTDTQHSNLSCSDDCESLRSQSPTPSLCSVTSVLEASDEHRLLGPPTTSARKRNHRRNTKRVQRVPAPEDRAQRRRRSLLFFTASSWGGTSTDPSDSIEADHLLLGTHKLEEPPSSKEGGPFPMPVILIDGPEGVVVGSEVDDDPDTLNCSFVESPQDPPVTSRRVWTTGPLKRVDAVGIANDGGICNHVLGGGSTTEAGEEGNGPTARREVGTRPLGEAREAASVSPSNQDSTVVDIFRRVSQGYRPPRRSISLPEVALEQGEEGREEEGDGDGEFWCSDVHECALPVQDLKDENGLAWNDTGSKLKRMKEGGGAGGREVEKLLQNGLDKETEMARDKKWKKQEKRRAAREGGDKVEESGLGFVRSHQRMSVADRIRRFNVLSALLRAPRPPPVPLAPPQRGPVRLRRQGARRFSRSVSHEGMTGLLQEPSTTELPSLSLEPLKHRDQDPSLNPVNLLNCINPQKTHNPLDPHNPTGLQSLAKPLDTHYSLDSANPSNLCRSQDFLDCSSPCDSFDCHNLFNPLKPHSPGEPLNGANLQNSVNLPKPQDHPNPTNSCDSLSPSLLNHQDLLNLHKHKDSLSHSSLRNPLSLPNILEPVNHVALSSLPPKPQRRHASRRLLPPNLMGQPYLYSQHFIEQEPPQDLDRLPQESELCIKQELQEAENGPLEPTLHKLLELQLHILPPGPPPETAASQNAPFSSSTSPLPGSPESPCLLCPPSPLPHHTNARSHRAPTSGPPTQPPSPSDLCCPLDTGGVIDFAPKMRACTDCSLGQCADALNKNGTGESDLGPSPSALCLRAPASRRRYRDSPRWPIPEIRITTSTPFQL